MLDQLLDYHDSPPPDDDFTARVMQRVKRQQRARRLILWGTGVIGAGFGIAGMKLLSTPLSQMMGDINPLYVSMAVVLTLGLMAWLLQDEAATTG